MSEQQMQGGVPTKNPMLRVTEGEASTLDRMFPGLAQKPCGATPAEIALLGKVMTAGKGALMPENLNIPAGYTYLGQFITHDISVDTSSVMKGKIEPDKARTPRLDLDSVYDSKLEEWGEIYCDSPGKDHGVKLKVGAVRGGGDPGIPDLPRSKEDFHAFIGDSRNDENSIISQLHSAFIAFHNAMVEKLRDTRPELSGRDLFERARQQVRWHYQWVVLWDFLPRVCGGVSYIQSLVDTVRRTGRLPHYRPPSRAFIPIEFWGAVFRVGHSMSRASYFLNDSLNGPLRTGAVRAIREPIPLLNADSNEPEVDLRGRRELFDEWGVEWKYFFPFSSPLNFLPPGPDAPAGSTSAEPSFGPQLSLCIDHEITAALAKLEGRSRDGKPSNSLIRLDLEIGSDLELPSGQAIAEVITGRANHLSERDLQTNNVDRKKEEVGSLPDRLLTDTPLFYYILKEAEVIERGRCLGPVGRTIAAETLVGLLRHNDNTILKIDPNWRPHAGAVSGEPYTMAHFLTFASQTRMSRPVGPWLPGAPVMV